MGSVFRRPCEDDQEDDALASAIRRKSKSAAPAKLGVGQRDPRLVGVSELKNPRNGSCSSAVMRLQVARRANWDLTWASFDARR